MTPLTTPCQQELQDRLSDPLVQQSLLRLVEHLDTLSFTLEALDGFFRRGETISDNVSESLQELRHIRMDDSGVGALVKEAPRLARTASRLAQTAARADLDALEQSKLLERLTQPQTLELLNQLLDRLPLLVMVVQGLDELLRRGETVADSLGESLREVVQGLAQVDQPALVQTLRLLPRLVEVGNRLVESGILEQAFPKLVEAGQQMLASGMLDAEVVRTLGQLGKALAESCREALQHPPEPIGGLWGLYRATRDPEIQKVLGFLVAVARGFSRKALS